MDQIQNSLEKIIRIPSNYRKGNSSPVTLLKESGYVELHEQINEPEIEEILKLYPQLINEWLLWSENKRSSPRWHFDKFEDDTYAVAYSIEGKEIEFNTKDEFKACAAFIMHEIEDTRIFIVNHP